MNEQKKSTCGCENCAGAACTCGCEKPAVKAACACGANCRCGDNCACAKTEGSRT